MGKIPEQDPMVKTTTIEIIYLLHLQVGCNAQFRGKKGAGYIPGAPFGKIEKQSEQEV